MGRMSFRTLYNANVILVTYSLFTISVTVFYKIAVVVQVPQLFHTCVTLWLVLAHKNPSFLHFAPELFIIFRWQLP